MVSPGGLEPVCGGRGERDLPVRIRVSSAASCRWTPPFQATFSCGVEQYRQMRDRSDMALAYGRCFVAGKLQNSRANLLRAARDNATDQDRDSLLQAAVDLAGAIRRLETCATLDEVRGTEGAAARVYFRAFAAMIRHGREDFAPNGRTRRPPMDRGNALLSFAYALLRSDCLAALVAAGLDPNVGYLHVDRPGRPSLALDLMEEFRPMLADRLILTLVNRRQIAAREFVVRDGGAVEMSAVARRSLVAAWQERKQEEVTHSLLAQTTRVGMLPYLQARILARVIRKELESYVPCVLK